MTEIQRLLLKGVLRPATVFEAENPGAMKSLSTKTVRTWRSKKRQGKASYLRRSRLVAREYGWLEASREGLFSPATSSTVTKLIPLMFL